MRHLTSELSRRAFTLVELSIVLVILGLVVGAFMAGEALMISARTNRTVMSAKEILAAAKQFKLKYGYFPADFPNATQVWGRADNGTPVTANCAAPSTDNANPNGTCNGNGDGAVTSGPEYKRFWQQLTLSGMSIGSPPVISPAMSALSNARATPVVSTMFSVVGSSLINNPGDPTDNHMYLFMGSAPGSGAMNKFTSDIVSSMDAKFDDGAPYWGMIRAVSLYDASCWTLTGTVYTYSKSSSAPCIIYFSTYQGRD